MQYQIYSDIWSSILGAGWWKERFNRLAIVTPWCQVGKYVNIGSITQKSVIWICYKTKKKRCNSIALFIKFLWLCITQSLFTHWSGFLYAISSNYLLYGIDKINRILSKNGFWLLQRILIKDNYPSLSRPIPWEQRISGRVVSDKAILLLYD